MLMQVKKEATVEEDTEKSTADLRREQRRKRILDSAKSRLEKLNGKVKENDSIKTEVQEYSDPEVDPNIPTGNIFFGDALNHPFLAAPMLNSPNPPDEPNFFVRTRAHIFIASIIGFALSLYIPHSLFVPLGLCVMIELFYFKGELYPNNNALVNAILPIVLLMTGASMNKLIKQALHFITITRSLLTNLAINIFCVCVISYFMQTMNLMQIVHIK